MILKYNIIILKYIFFISFFVILSLPVKSELDLSVEEIIKGRKALFSKNYSTAKRVQALASKDEFEINDPEIKKILLKIKVLFYREVIKRRVKMLYL